MKKFIALAVVVVVAALAITTIVSAQKPTPTTPGQGWGMMNGRGGMMGGGAVRGGRGGMMGANAGQGLMHDYMQKELAAKLDMSVEDLQALYAKGQTFWQIAEDKGLTTEQAQQIMVDARATALDKMVADGVITQEQADWMKNRMNGAGRGGYGAGSCMGGNWDNSNTPSDGSTY